ncbi:MAG: hypothetical protein GY913_02870 [Proteobacteria bacterium]|nr:hypothetical protein [Pseudomonadota bacterium]MCP4915841.1 hypothetical protein [Pseudomonadota bacterium]
MGCLGHEVNRVVNLETGLQLELERAVEGPALFDGGMTGATGTWHFPVTTPVDKPSPIEATSAWASDGARHAVATSDGVLVLEGNRRRLIEVEVAPWMPPAVGEDVIAWVSGEHVFVERDGEVEDLGPGWHVAASASSLAWITPDGVCIDERCIPTDAHASKRLSLDGDVACWEHWNGSDVDVWCSDGVRIEGPGHQRSPSRSGSRVLYREDGQTLLWTLPEPKAAILPE